MTINDDQLTIFLTNINDKQLADSTAVCVGIAVERGAGNPRIFDFF
jgi:hypothetical protein